MKNAIIIHGCSSSPHEEIECDPAKHWMPWVRDELMARNIPAKILRMPESWAPDYDAWRKVLEKEAITEQSILIGHSCGSAFLVRWLGDSKQKIDSLFLIAPWKIGTSSEAKKKFYDYQIDKTIKSRVNRIVTFTADNEEEAGKRSLKIFHDFLGGKIIELKGRGHYTEEDMKTGEFPELLSEIVGSVSQG